MHAFKLTFSDDLIIPIVMRVAQIHSCIQWVITLNLLFDIRNNQRKVLIYLQLCVLAIICTTQNVQKFH